ncbi:hypothetical protein [Streptomyces sp. NBC_01198]|uniref:hypothetical protein n=1 Tax=Streptomyces sp. NBC_01198 TaxID=2903769 RepID=UPI002E0E28B4|nr:hypothetical protein OG702_19630 [Streptomyces sp. NBC_01198]
MSTLPKNLPPAPRTTARKRPRLSPPWRKLLLTIHVTVSVGLLGTDAAVVALVTSGWLGHARPVTVYPAAHLLGEYLLLPLALLALVTGLALGLLTPWGLLRYWWVLISLAVNTVGTALAVFVLLPGLDTAATAALAGHAVASPSSLVRDSGAACCVLIATVAISYYKPFGRIRRRS